MMQRGKSWWFILVLVIGVGVLVYIYFGFLQPTGPGTGPTTGGDSSGSGGTSGSETPWQTNNLQPFPPSLSSKTRVVVVRNPKIKDEKGDFQMIQLQKSVNIALSILFGTDRAEDALRQIIRAGDKVGLKIHGYRGEKGNITHPELVDTVVHFLRQIKVVDNDIVVWDEDRGHLEKGGYKFNRSGTGVRCLATLHKKPRDLGTEIIMGFEDQEISVGKIKTRLAKIQTRFTTVTINMPFLKTCTLKGNVSIEGSLLNMYRAIEMTDQNLTQLYHNGCDPVAADVYSRPEIKDKTKLIICDALTPLYNGGPMDDPRYHTNYNGIIVGLDPVAVDAVGQDILQKIREKKLGKDAPKLISKYLDTASSS